MALREEVLQILEDSEVPLSTFVVKEKLEEPDSVTHSIVGRSLLSLLKEGLVEEGPHGTWQLATTPSSSRTKPTQLQTDPTNPHTIFEEFDEVPTAEEDSTTIKELGIIPGE